MQDGVKFDLTIHSFTEKICANSATKMATYAHAQTATFKIMWKHKNINMHDIITLFTENVRTPCRP